MVDALVSNTNVFGRAGSSPGPGYEKAPSEMEGPFVILKEYIKKQIAKDLAVANKG